MFMGPFDEGGDWNDKGIKGVNKFLQRSWRLIYNENLYQETFDDLFIIHSTIKNVSNNLKDMKFNTAISRLMEFVNYFYSKGLNRGTAKIYIQLLAPLAPHFSEELWSRFNDNSVFLSDWPSFDNKYLEKKLINIAVQVNGKLRASIQVDKDITKDELISICYKNDNVSKYLNKKKIIKEIYVPNKIVNIVIK